MTQLDQDIKSKIRDEAMQVASIWGDRYGLSGITIYDLASIERFIERLGFSSTLDAMEIATVRWRYSHRSGFKYFCGICWTRIRELEGVCK